MSGPSETSSDSQLTSSSAGRPDPGFESVHVATPTSTKPEQRTIGSDDSKIVIDDRRNVRPGDKSVLLIEDDELLVEVLLKQIRQRGYKCLIAGDGVTGLQLADQYGPSCILLDLMIPFIDGFDFLRLLKENLSTRAIPVCTMSASDPETAPQKLGALNHLMKPFDASALDKIFEHFEYVFGKTTNSLLVVEDSEASQAATSTLLSDDGLEIVCATTAEEACELIDERKFDCIITDVKLPGMSGVELIQRLHQSEGSRTTPVIVYTGKALTSDECEILHRYAARVVMKAADDSAALVDAVSLFLHRGEKSLTESHRQAIHSLHDPNEALQGRSVLVVDDDVRNAFAMSKTLGDAGLNVAIADNGELAIAKLESDPNIDIVLMDIMMPVMNGYEATTKIRENEHFAKLPIIALTAKGMSEDRDKAIQCGANDYLTKPVDIDRLLAMMKMWLHSATTGKITDQIEQELALV